MKVSKGQLKAKMFEYFREIERTGRPLIVTDHGTPVLVVQLYTAARPVEVVFGPMRGKVNYAQDTWASENEDWGELA